MYPERLNNDEHYYYKNTDIYSLTSNIIKCFVQNSYSIGMHIQDFFEINIILNGKGMHYIENSSIEVKTGDVFVIPPYIPHGYSGGIGFDVCHVLISKEFMEKYIADLQLLPSFFILFNAEPIIRSTSETPLYLTLDNDEFEKTVDYLNSLKDCKKVQNSSVALITSSSLALILIAYLCEIYSNKTKSTSSPQTDTAFLNALALIHSRYSEKLTIEKLAHTAQLSRSAFIKKFNEICKTTPARYINNVRISAAKHMLTSTSLSIDEIAIRAGFYDAPHFIKTFTTQASTTPNLYRKKNTKHMY